MRTSLTAHLGPSRKGSSIASRLARRTRVNPTTGCHEWIGMVDGDGYGRMKVSTGPRTYQLRPVHRLSFEASRGDIPDGLTLDHLCRVRRCINPDHLEAVPNAVNILRGTAPSAVNATKTHCINGHAFDTNNTRTTSGYRECIICRRAQGRSKYFRRKERLLAHPN